MVIIICGDEEPRKALKQEIDNHICVFLRIVLAPGQRESEWDTGREQDAQV